LTIVGILDTSFGTGGIVTTLMGAANLCNSVVLQSDGKIVLGGYSTATFPGADFDFALLRYTSDGSPDNTFSGDGKVTTNLGSVDDYARAISIQPDGKVVAAGQYHNGSNYDIAVVRYDSAGTPDITFNGNGVVITPIGTSHELGTAVVIQPNGMILIAGYSNAADTNFALVRYTSDGSLDLAFGNNGIVTTPIAGSENSTAMALQLDEKILLAGQAYAGTNYDFRIVRYLADGSLDLSFGNNGIVTTPIGNSDDECYDIVLQSDGKILAVGASYNGNNYDLAIVRYNSDGTLDNEFNGTGKVINPVGTDHDFGRGIKLATNGSIFVAGNSREAGQYKIVVLRYTTEGTLDTTFGSAGKFMTSVGSADATSVDIAVQPDGKIIVTGAAAENGTAVFFALRLQ
jgi:uncharacterized delta-60 repeat protein